MKIFLITNYDSVHVYKGGFSSGECIDLTSRSPANILSSDVREWADTAEHESIFRLSFVSKLICLDMSKYE